MMTELATQPSSLEVGQGRFSLRRMMLCTGAIAVGLAVAQSSCFAHFHGFFAVAAVLLIAQLLSETKFIRSHPGLAEADRSFHLRLRMLLIFVIVGFFALVFVQQVLYRPSYYTPVPWFERYMFDEVSSWANSTEAMLQVAFFGFLILGLPRPKPTRWRIPLLICALVWSGILIYEYGFIISLVQIAIEAVEISMPGAQFGVASQYAIDSGSMYAGINPDLRARGLVFIRNSGIGAIAFFFCGVVGIWLTYRFRNRKNSASTWNIVAMMGLIAVAAVYLVWVYAIGLRQLCPPYAEAGIAAGWIPLVCGFIAVALVSTLLAYRSRAFDDETSKLTLPPTHITTLVAIVLANMAWLGLFDIRVLGRLAAMMDWSSMGETILLSTTCYFSLATISLIVGELYYRAFATQHRRRLIGRIDAASMRFTFIALFSSILLWAPTMWWIGYALRIYLNKR